MKLTALNLPGMFVLEREPVCDQRGRFARLFCLDFLSEILNGRQIVQINHSVTKARGALRGLHFQFPPYAEMKLVTSLKGEVFDVAVDLRRESVAYLKWHAEILSSACNRTLIIPESFAHGFQSLTEGCELLYLHTCAYRPGSEGGLNAMDPALDISWPLPLSDISQRDQKHDFISTGFQGLTL